MPTIWYVCDGPRPDTTKTEGIPVSFFELENAFSEFKVDFRSEEPPEFNTDNPSRYAQRVVVEITEDDGVEGRFPKIGFYAFSDLSPKKAHQLLSNVREKR